MKRIIILLALLIPRVASAGFVGYLKADTQVVVTIGPFVDVGDGFTPQTDITLAGDMAEIVKHGATSGTDISGRTWDVLNTAVDGYYNLTLTTDDTNTEGMLHVIVQDNSDCLPVHCTFMVVNDNTYEAFFENAAEILKVDLVQINTIATQLQMLIDASTTINADADLTSIVVDKSVMSHVMTPAADTSTYQASTDSQEAIKVHADTIKAETVLILADTDDIGAAGAGLTAIPWNSDWDAEVQSEVNDELVLQNLDHLLKATTNVATDGDLEDYVVGGTIMAHLMGEDSDVTVYKASTDAMSLGAASAASVADAVWDELVTGHDGAGKAGQQLWTDLDAVLADTGELQVDDYPTSIAAIQTTVDTIEADTEAMDTAGEWDTLMATIITGVNVSSVSADAIEAGDFKTGAIDADAIATDAIDADAVKADTWTELLVVPFIDIGAGAPPYNAGWFLGLNYLYEAYRNRFVTNTTGGVTEGRYYKNDGTTILTESNQSDDGAGTFDREELGAED